MTHADEELINRVAKTIFKEVHDDTMWVEDEIVERYRGIAKNIISMVHESAPKEKSNVKPLDLSNLLRHAFMTGWNSPRNYGSVNVAWEDYDPADCAAYDRIDGALRSGSK